MSTRVEDDGELLRRQVPSEWVDEQGLPLSVAFAPTPSHHRLLSTDRGYVPVREAFEGYATRTGRSPHSTWPMSVGLIRSVHELIPQRPFDPLYVLDDGGEDGVHEGHASVVFPEQPSPSAERKTFERIRKVFRDDARARGRLHP